MAMQERLKRYALVLSLFVFLFVTLGGGFHLNPAGAFVAAMSGTPLVIYAFNRRSNLLSQRTSGHRTLTSREVHEGFGKERPGEP